MTKEELEKKVEELEEKVKRLENPTYPLMPNLPNSQSILDPECLHNGCGSRTGGNSTCMLYCPHCSLRC